MSLFWAGGRNALDLDQLLAGKLVSTSPFIAAILGVKDASGVSMKSGYCFRMYLPTASGVAAAEGSGPAAASSADADAQEVRWACYAWPAAPGSGLRAFMASHTGEVYATSARVTPYVGSGGGPAAEAAFDASGLAPRNLDAGIGIAAAGLTACDGNTWVPAGN